MIERRKEPRKEIAYPVYFASLNSEGLETTQDFAMLVNISRTGVLLESALPILTKEIKIIASFKNKGDFEVFAELVYSIQMTENQFRSGLSLKGDPDQIQQFVTALIDVMDG